MMSGEGAQCSEDGTLASGSNCSLACKSGYVLADDSPTHYYCFSGTYSTTSLTPSTRTGVVKCVPGPCQLAASFGLGVEGKKGPAGCVANGTIASGSVCEVQCSLGYYPASASTFVNECSATKFTVAASLQCLPGSCRPYFGFGIQGTATAGCTNAQEIESGSSCEIECKPGMVNRGGTTTYSCSAGFIEAATLVCGVGCGPVDETVYPDGIESASTNGCADVVGELGSGESCSVQCKKGYKFRQGTTEYSCAKNWVSFTKPTLICDPNPCNMPKQFPYGITTATYGGAVFGCEGHNYIYIGHKYIGHNYMGHN